MAVRKILRLGDPRLRMVSTAVQQFGTEALNELVADMFDTMAAANGAGLAAPQIGIQQRVMIFGLEHNPRYPDAEPVPTTVLINPEHEIIGVAQQGNWEGCLSVPGMRGYVTRPSQIRYRGFDVSGKRIERIAAGFHAAVFLHENDHLDGILYTDRIEDRSRFGFVEELYASGVIVASPVQ